MSIFASDATTNTIAAVAYPPASPAPAPSLVIDSQSAPMAGETFKPRTSHPYNTMSTATLPSTAECGSTLARENAARYTVLATEIMTLANRRRQVELYHRTAGYTLAGSCLRLQRTECWGYTWSDGRATHGRSFATLAEAQAAFSNL